MNEGNKKNNMANQKDKKKQQPAEEKQAASNSATKQNNGKEQGQEQTKPTEPPFIIHRSKDGLKLIKSFHDKIVCKDEIVLAKSEGKDDRVESVCCSEDGELVAWCDDKVIKCIKLETNEVVFEQPNTCKSNCVYISPRSTKLITYTTMSGGDNLHFWNLSNQEHIASMPFRKASQWKPVFSMNEDVCLQQVTNELILYVGGNLAKPKQRISHVRVTDFSLSSASEQETSYQHLYAKRSKNKTHYIAVYTSGAKGQPSIVKIYKYPNLTDCITNKSFFKADRVKFNWSPSGNSLLLTCLSDFDQSGKSYYGEQSLNYLNVKGDSYFVKLPKEGAISHIEWFPSCDKDMFVCVYGLMPAKVSLFNNKCEVMYNFGDQGSFNAVSFSPFGNLLAVYGIGNLSGQLNIWDFEKKKLISNVKVPETTGIQWCADGIHLLTCTTSPRLRVGNGFRLWHHSGSLIYENIGSNDPAMNREIYDVFFQPKPGSYKRPKIESKSTQLPNLMAQSKLSKLQGSAGKYVPPAMRNQTASGPSFIDSAVGLGAGNRPIVGLESLNKDRASNAKKGPNKKGPNKNATAISG